MNSFEKKVIKNFRYQYNNNNTYKEFCDLINKNIDVSNIKNIPFLPIEFFKSHVIKCFEKEEKIFESSGTTGKKSYHYINDLNIYRKSLISCFEYFFGNPKQFNFFALLPNYKQKPSSSLVFMCNEIINKTERKTSGFYLNKTEELFNEMKKINDSNEKIFLIGLSNALVDFCKEFKIKLKNAIVVETGGSKGYGKDYTKIELHEELKKGFGVKVIHSEYRMTELFSQAYSMKNGIFYCPPSMKIMIRDLKDPLKISNTGSGVLNIIDLSNTNTCSFIATNDLGVCYEDGSFEITGRCDYSEIRGCSLMYHQL